MIVVAHYDEDLNWLKAKYNPKEYIIFTKKNNLDLPNVGRESHTYVNYIVRNYHNLHDVTVFLQGNPFDHFPEGGIESMTEQAKSHPSGLSQNAYVHDRGMNSAFTQFTIYQHSGQTVTPYKTNYNLGEWLLETCQVTYSRSPKWYIGACFAATRAAIQSVSLDTWTRILESLAYDVNPVTGHYMERSWYFLMDLERHMGTGVKRLL